MLIAAISSQNSKSAVPASDKVLSGLRDFYGGTSRSDGSFAPGIDRDYRGISDSAYSDLAPVTYAAIIHRSLGWELPHKEKTIQFLLSRQHESGDFFNVAGTVDSKSSEGRAYNTTQGIVALHTLGAKPRFNPLPVFEDVKSAKLSTLAKRR